MSAATDYVQLTHATSEIDGTIDEVYAARGTYGNLSGRIASKQDALSQSQLAATNSGITAAKLAADEAAAIKAVDEGSKNLCNWSGSTSTISDVTFIINSDKTVSTSGTATARAQKSLTFTVPSTLKAGRYVLSGCPSGGEQSGTTLYCLYLWDKTVNARVASGDDTGNGIEFDWIPDASHTYSISVDVRSGTNASGLTFKPMICTAADFAVSQKFVPYCPSMAEMYEMILALQNGTRSAPALAKAEPEVEPETGEEGEQR